MIKSPLKWFAIAVGGTVAVAHIGILGHVLHQPEIAQAPTFNIPDGPYSSYRITAGKDGYEIEYRANDPKILESERSLELDHERRGLFGGGREQRTEHRRDQFTMDGTRNLGGGSLEGEGKLGAQSAECIAADAGARSQGAMAGTSIAAGVIVPAVSNIPYVGWLASGWALLLGQQAGSYVGGEVGTVFNDC